MKTKKFLLGTFFFAATMALVLFSCQKDQVEMNDGASFIKLKSNVEPVAIDPWKSGDAKFECGQTSCDNDFSFKIDLAAPNGIYTTDKGNIITISNSDGKTFDWSSDYPVCAVIVKAGTGALIYYYNDAYGDTGLSAFEGKDISHVTFCYNDPEMCYEEETAWTKGTTYVKKGNWAMYTAYSDAEKTVDLIADGGDPATAKAVGTATFSAPVDGYVTITIELTGGAIFYYDLNDPLKDDNLKVQDYAKAPTKTPAPGQFAWKTRIEPGLTTGSIVVPVNNFYGVHLDVAVPVPCE